MQKVQWIISDELGSDSDITKVISAIQHNEGCVYSPVGLKDILTPSFVPSYDTSIPTIFYGPTNFISRMEKRKEYSPGVMGNDKTFSYENVYSVIPGELFLNSPDVTKIGTSEEILTALAGSKADLYFFRPNFDNKLITGSVRNKTTIESICENVLEGRIDNANKDTKFVLSMPYGISEEYRLFIVDGKVISISKYNPDRKYIESVPEIMADLVNTVTSLWNETPWYILDVCISNKRPYIMEIQNFHSAGFYATQINDVICAINKKALSL